MFILVCFGYNIILGLLISIQIMLTLVCFEYNII